jgi:hypothetical protein
VGGRGGEAQEQIKGKGRCMGEGEEERGKWEVRGRVREGRGGEWEVRGRVGEGRRGEREVASEK